MNNKLAIISVNYKNYQVTEEFLDCFKNQKNKNFKIFIADLTEDPKIIKKETFLDVILGKNGGYAYGVNLGIRKAISEGYEKFVVINNDVRVENNFIDLAISSLQKNAGSLIAGKIYYEKGYEYHKKYKKEDLGKVIWYAGGKNDWANVYTSHIGVDEVDNGQYDEKKEVDFITGCLMLYDKKVYDKVGDWDDSYFLYYEDADFCARAKNKGIKLLYDPSVKIWHKNSQSTGGSGSSLHVKYQTKNRIKYGLKFAPLKTKLHLLKEFLFINAWPSILFLIVFFIAIRSINFVDHLNFSGDQATHSATALELFKSGKITLIGNPITSTVYEGRMLFQGPLVYYMYMFFLLVGNWDPVLSSYAFMIFCALMIIPLFWGTKRLLGYRSALLVCLAFTLLPYYINYTRFLWNPNFQLSSLPLLIFFMGEFKKANRQWVFFVISILLGLLLQLHYQFILIVIGLILYYFLFKKIGFKKYFLIIILGILIGFSPVLIFEARHNFYNFNTGILMLTHWGDVQKAGSSNTPHYYLSISLMTLILFFSFFADRIEKINRKKFIYLFTSIFLILLIYSYIIFSPKPAHGFWSTVNNWYYEDEYNVAKIIEKENLKDFNVVNLLYDAKSKVIIYFLKRDGFVENWDEYYKEKYLFVVDYRDDFMSRPVYEVNEFKPSKIIKKWQLNDRGVKVFLLERK